MTSSFLALCTINRCCFSIICFILFFYNDRVFLSRHKQTKHESTPSFPDSLYISYLPQMTSNLLEMKGFVHWMCMVQLSIYTKCEIYPRSPLNILCLQGFHNLIPVDPKQLWTPIKKKGFFLTVKKFLFSNFHGFAWSIPLVTMLLKCKWILYQYLVRSLKIQRLADELWFVGCSSLEISAQLIQMKLLLNRLTEL